MKNIITKLGVATAALTLSLGAFAQDQERPDRPDRPDRPPRGERGPRLEPGAMAKQAIEEHDKDKDGKLSVEELTAYFQQRASRFGGGAGGFRRGQGGEGPRGPGTQSDRPRRPRPDNDDAGDGGDAGDGDAGDGNS